MNAICRSIAAIESLPDLVGRLLDIWSRTLQVSPVFPDSNFFDLGGDSLLAVALLLEVERETGRHFPITTIYDAPTVAELAELIESDTAVQFSPLVQLKEGDGRPFFIVHGLGGTVIELAALGKLVRTDGPIYAIQARGLDGGQAPIETVEEMAEYYVDAITRMQPHGPYLLGGYSFGGLVAFEMARRLWDAQDEIALLLMIDSYALPRTWPARSRVKARARRLRNRLDRMVRQPIDETLARLLHHASKLRTRLKTGGTGDHVTRVTEAQRWLGMADPSLPLALRQVRNASDAALQSYSPRYYPGDITFLRAATTLPVFPVDARNIWGGLARGCEFRTIQGDHYSIIGEHAAGTAAAISTCLSPESRRSVAARRDMQCPLATTPVLSGFPLQSGGY